MRYSEFKTVTEAIAPAPINPSLMQRAKQGVSNLAKSSAAKATGNAIASGLGSLGFAGDKILGFNNPLKDKSRALASTKIFIKQFLGTLTATQKRQQQMGQPFDLATFANAYMKKYNWQPGTLKAELDTALRSNNSQKLAIVMDKIGSANTVDPNAPGAELNMTAGAKPAPATAASPTAPVQVSVGGKPGQTMNPNDPADAQILAALKKQGKI